MLKHPLVEAALFGGLAVSSLVSNSWQMWAAHGTILIGIILLQNTDISALWNRVRHLVWFFPILLGIFLISSLIFSNITLLEALESGSFSMLRFVCAGLFMGVFMGRGRERSVFQSLRSMWMKIGKPWKRVEDLFLFLGLTLRFFPSIQRQWAQLQSSKDSLGLGENFGKRKQAASLLSDLPGFLIYRLNKAETTSLAMSLRGYGNQIPRGVAEYVPFGFWDGLKLIAVISVLTSLHYFAPI